MSSKVNYHRDLDPAPKSGVCVHVERYPDCDLCKIEGHNGVAKYDAKTKNGPWGYLCAQHFKSSAASQRLGVGLGQRLTLRRE